MIQYLQFNKITERLTTIWSIREKIELGKLEKTRVGQWESFCLFLNQDCYLGASCQDEVRAQTRLLNSKNNKQDNSSIFSVIEGPKNQVPKIETEEEKIKRKRKEGNGMTYEEARCGGYFD